MLKENADNIIGSYVLAKSYDEALQILSSAEDFELSILDVKLDRGKSFKLVENFPKHRFGLITFMTAEDIPSHINRLAHPVLQIEKPFDKEQIANFVSEVKKIKKSFSQIHLISKTDGRAIFLSEEQIYIVNTVPGTKHSEVFYLDKETHKIISLASTIDLSGFSEILSTDFFVKCNGSCIVNVAHVVEIHRAERNLILDHSDLPEVGYSLNFLDGVIKRKISMHR